MQKEYKIHSKGIKIHAIRVQVAIERRQITTESSQMSVGGRQITDKNSQMSVGGRQITDERSQMSVDGRQVHVIGIQSPAFKNKKEQNILLMEEINGLFGCIPVGENGEDIALTQRKKKKKCKQKHL